jgi:hypothetical protein
VNEFRRENMKSKIAIISVVILIMVSVFTGCEVKVESRLSEAQFTADSRGVSSQEENKKEDFYATVTVYQDYLNVVTEHKGKSNHYKTIEETLYSDGGAIVSDWDLLNGKDVEMTNETNYNLDYATGEISGANHSIINVVESDGSVILTLKANGTIKGSLLGAAVKMHFVIEDSYGLDIKGNGTIEGSFVWAELTMGGIEKITPYGTFTLNGSFK